MTTEKTGNCPLPPGVEALLKQGRTLKQAIREAGQNKQPATPKPKNT